MDYKNYLNATIICYISREVIAKKYHSIHRSKVKAFEQFAKKTFPGAHHVNYYSKETKQFEFRVYL
jgi:hypothetical protein